MQGLPADVPGEGHSGAAMVPGPPVLLSHVRLHHRQGHSVHPVHLYAQSIFLLVCIVLSM